MLWLDLYRGVISPLLKRSPFGCRWWPELLLHRILVAKKSWIWQPKWSRDFQHFSSSFTKLEVCLERSNAVLSSPSKYTTGLVDWCWKIHQLHLCRGVRPTQWVSWYDTKQFDGYVLVMRSTPLLPSLPGPRWSEVVAFDWVMSMGQMHT